MEVKGLRKNYGGVPVLADVSFTAGPGVTCIMATSGAGKTTLLRILLGLERADGGAVEGLAGRRLSAVFQEDRLLEHLDWRENLRFALGPAFREEQAAELLAALGLEDLKGKPVRAYSGGMKRRLALARALLVPFDVLVLDEPFTGLDGENRRRAVDALRDRTAGKTVLLVTHDAADAQAMGGRIVRLP